MNGDGGMTNGDDGKRKKPILVLINPKSGTGHSMSMYTKQLVPELQSLGVRHELIKTEYAGHARKVASELDLDEYSGIACISGDGLVHEVYNGLYTRSDWDEKASRIPIGLVPGGSGCALNCSLLIMNKQKLDGLNSLGSAASARNVAVGAAKGRSTKLDLFEIEMKSCEKRKILSFVGVTFGVIADCDLGSEWLRFMGYIRTYFYVVGRIIKPKEYRAKLSYLPHPVDPASGRPVPGETLPEVRLPALSSPVPDSWTTIEDEFRIAYALNLSHLDPATMFAPQSTLGDGVMWLAVVGQITFADSLKWLANSDKGFLKGNPHMRLIPVQAFRFEPVFPLDGFMSLDAESVAFEPLQGRILRGKARIMSEV